MNKINGEVILKKEELATKYFPRGTMCVMLLQDQAAEINPK